MAKQIFTINKFHGGISEVSDPRDIEDNEMSVLKGANVSHLGKIILLGDLVAHEAGSAPGDELTDEPKVISPGYGFFSFKTDFNNAAELDIAYYEFYDPTTAPLARSENYLALINGKSGIIRLYTASTDQWQNSIHDPYAWRLTTGGNLSEPPDVVYIRGSADFRASDGNFDNITGDTINPGAVGSKNQVGWLGHIQRKRWTGLTTVVANAAGTYFTQKETSINMWKGTHSEIKSPEQLGVIGLLKLEEATDEFPDENALTLGDGVASFEGAFYLSVSANKTEEGGWRGFKQYYMSFIYDGIQESMISPFWSQSSGSLGLDVCWEDSKKAFRLRHRIKDHWYDLGDYPLNQRITGGRIYFKETNSQFQAQGDAILLFEFDLDKGSKKFLDTEWSEWEYDLNADSLNVHAVRTPAGGGVSSGNNSDGMMVFNSEPNGPTHEALSGISGDETSIYACYKTAVIANNRLYAANIGQVDPNVTRNKDAYTFSGDVMLKSPPLKYDILPSLSKIEVTIGDGDDITCLESYADRLLQFKSQKLHIINISQDFEFLEQTLNFKGVEHPGAVCKTDFGIAWLNEYGCFLYDGERVTDLLEKKARKLIDQSTWSSFIGAHPTIGFDPRTKDLICKGDNEIDSTGEIYIYNLIIQGWVNDANAFVDLHDQTGSNDGNAASNMFPDYNGELCVAGESQIYHWSPGPSNNIIDIKTKDFDFGAPGVKKKIYKVYISYKDGVSDDSGGAGVLIKYQVNGSTTNYNFNGVGTNTSDTSPLIDANNVNEWKVAELIPATSSEASNIYSFSLTISSTSNVSSTFEINDISIVYRTKNIK